MKITNIYPSRKKRSFNRNNLVKIARWPFLSALYVCPVINIIYGGPAWSVIVLWSLWIVWTFIVSPYVVEYNRISQFVKLITNSAILLVLIKLILAPEMPLKVIPIVGFGGVVLIMTLFVTDLRKQRQNMMPLLVFIVVSIALSSAGLIIWGTKSDWSIIVLIMTSVASLLSTMIILKKNLLTELKKRFSVK